MTSVGTSIPRREDGRLLRGWGRFVDDISVPGQLWMRVVRSSVAHARLAGIETSQAEDDPRVHAVLTGEDLRHIAPIPMRFQSAQPLDDVLQPVLARERVRYVGEPVAVVVASDAYACEDVAEKVKVGYEPLEAIVESRTAQSQPSMWEARGNEICSLEYAFGDVDTAFGTAAHVIELDLSIGRHSGVPLETRGLLAAYDRARSHIRVWGPTKVPHHNRRVLSDLLNHPLNSLEFNNVDAGGGFGVRGEFYPEDFLVPYLARELGRPVKWVEDRSEHLVSANHSRQQQHLIAIALDADGRIMGLRDEIWHDTGAYLRTHGVIVPERTISMLPGPYRIENYRAIVHVLTTNKSPAGTYRGPGRYEGTFVREHLLNLASHRLGIDRAELRRRNLLSADELPLTRDGGFAGSQVTLKKGDYSGLLDRALSASKFADWEREAVVAREDGRCVGTGLCFFMEKSDLGPYENATVEVDTSGGVRVLAGGTSLGQGIETVLAQVAADQLGINPADVDVLHGDTALVPDGVGSFASRTTVVGGSAVHEAARHVAERAKKIGASLLGVPENMVVLDDGRVRTDDVEGRSVGLGEIAVAANDPMHSGSGDEVGLRKTEQWFAGKTNYPYGVHLAQVEVDPATGGVTVLRYFIAYEIGKAINPRLVEGQLVGGAAQGIGGALLEEFTYDLQGQPQATTFMDYLIPTAAEIPRVQTLIVEDAAPDDNPLGAMGAGEGGTTGCGGVIADAVEDAIGQRGVIEQLPITPSRLVEYIAVST